MSTLFKAISFSKDFMVHRSPKVNISKYTITAQQDHREKGEVSGQPEPGRFLFYL